MKHILMILLTAVVVFGGDPVPDYSKEMVEKLVKTEQVGYVTQRLIDGGFVCQTAGKHFWVQSTLVYAVISSCATRTCELCHRSETKCDGQWK